MATDYLLPDLGEDIEEAEVIAVHVHAGDRVERDQAVIEVETEKANLDVPAPYAGAITAVHVSVGDTIRPGQAIVAIEAEEGVKPSSPAVSMTPPAASAPPAIEPDAAPPAPPAAAPAPPPAAAARPPGAATPVLPSDGGLVPASPSVRMFAREIGVALGEVAGTGPGGRVSIDDVKAHARLMRSAAAPAEAPEAPRRGAAPAPSALPDLSQFGEVERERMSGVRRTTARTLSQSWAQSPHVMLQRKADVTELEAIRRANRERVAAAGGQLTMMPILLKVVAGALREFPRLNASIDVASEEIVYRRYVHVGVATDTDHGLIVPVVRNADEKSITQLSIEIGELVGRARDRKSTLEDLRGGTFTISNLGGMGIGFFNAVLLPPQVGILAVGRAEQEPVWTGSEFEPRLRMPLAINFDHRLIDGADGARALAWICETLEQPQPYMLEEFPESETGAED
ncbi:MAG: branched-chain alpha-keto acid dehydrogenase subunit E2 [Chloroflexi bacterium]|nr:branched-chain alpha-keto acid dehydrogenase subunit E2 [Chloroflexota bacterium]